MLLRDLLGGWKLVSLDETITMAALVGPTQDFEDNVQIQSALSAECQLFLTRDKNLLKMKFVEQMRFAQSVG